MIQYFYRLPVRKKIKPIVKISSPFKKNTCFDSGYMDVKKEVERSLNSFKLLKKMNLPHDDVFYAVKETEDFDSFYKMTQMVNINVWVELLYWFIKKHSHMLIDQYYLRWKIRALSFCLHEINTSEQAEKRTIFQAKTAYDFMHKIGEHASIDEDSKKLYFYQSR